jgi:hypothetical protein
MSPSNVGRNTRTIDGLMVIGLGLCGFDLTPVGITRDISSQLRLTVFIGLLDAVRTEGNSMF